ncbi:class F sortase [Flexivirga caeni]|uniref:Class F sortase n=1 Tax=Flexivirga caeni TaxID=2294115 RepID=A0A3M9MKE3_9MICO|nr:class F sortase [Flexivirga caeni]RNI25138.1 class F sortase [Flexivirga caeni]
MNNSTPAHHGRRWATVVSGMLTIAAIVLVVIGLRGQVHAATPPVSAAHPSAEGNLPAPSSSNSAPSRQTTSRATTPATPPTVGPVLRRSVPKTLSIPAIGINDARLAAFGTDSQGAIAVPPATPGVPPGWYTGSPTPGQLGPSVLVGHTDEQKDAQSVFFRLGQLRPGDLVRVTLADRIVATFRVDSLEEYPKASFPTAHVYGNINHAGLRLISCIGKFDRATGHYLDNIVVYAHLISSHPS